MTAIDESPVQPRKKHRTMLLVTLILVVVIVLAAVAYILLHKRGTEVMFQGYRYTVVYTTHTSAGNSTIFNHVNSTTWTMSYTPGQSFAMTSPFYNNVSGGTTKVSGISCETPGFAFVNSSLAFPFTVPTSLDSSVTNNNVKVLLTFSTPTTPYTGPLVYTAYFDYYPAS